MAAIRPVHFERLIRVFERDGFSFKRQEGDHRMYFKPGIKRPIVIPTYRLVPVFIIRNLIRTAGMTRDRYFELLDEA